LAAYIRASNEIVGLGEHVGAVAEHTCEVRPDGIVSTYGVLPDEDAESAECVLAGA
jgi:hypothetical protein